MRSPNETEILQRAGWQKRRMCANYFRQLIVVRMVALMKRILQLLAVLVLLAAGVTWLATGANRGWTKTSVPVKTLDQVTGIEGISYQQKFLPGVDFLGAALLGAGVLAGVSFCFRNQKPTNQPNQAAK
jgi:hypothetical protein